MNSKFYINPSVRTAAGYHSPIASSHYLGHMTLHADGGGLYWFGPPTYLELHQALPAEIVEHAGRFVLTDRFTSIQTLHQGIYEVKIDGAVIKAELNRRLINGYEDEESTGLQLEYDLSVQSEDAKHLPIALGVYDQIRQCKLQPVKSWDGPLPTA